MGGEGLYCTEPCCGGEGVVGVYEGYCCDAIDCEECGGEGRVEY